MILKTPRFVFCLALICLLPLIGCAGKSRPKTSPDQPKQNAKAEKKAVVAEYLKKLAVVGCDGQKIKDVPGPLKDHREKIKLHYGHFFDSEGYKGEKKILDRCSSVDAIDRFVEVFWSVRDPDITTLENENKLLVDKRIREIEQDILFRDKDVPGTRFSSNGGLRGDMAHVYMFRGDAAYKIKTTRTTRLADLMAWIYFDENGFPVYVFLFYDKGSGYQLFRNYQNFDGIESLMNTLRELAKMFPTSEDDYTQLYQELIDNDPEYIFRFAINKFSYYTDIKLDKVLSPPTPESMTARAIQPKILGVPNIPKNVKMVMSEYFSKITGYSLLTRNSNGEYNLKLTIAITGVDWEDSSGSLRSGFDLSISVTNEKTREKKYFATGLNLSLPADKYSKIYFTINPNEIKNRVIGMEGTLPDLFKTLPPGDYEVKINLLNQTTLKSGTWYQYITIK